MVTRVHERWNARVRGQAEGKSHRIAFASPPCNAISLAECARRDRRMVRDLTFDLF
jgi:hypothetical protein